MNNGRVYLEIDIITLMAFCCKCKSHCVIVLEPMLGDLCKYLATMLLLVLLHIQHNIKISYMHCIGTRNRHRKYLSIKCLILVVMQLSCGRRRAPMISLYRAGNSFRFVQTGRFGKYFQQYYKCQASKPVVSRKRDSHN